MTWNTRQGSNTLYKRDVNLKKDRPLPLRQIFPLLSMHGSLCLSSRHMLHACYALFVYPVCSSGTKSSALKYRMTGFYLDLAPLSTHPPGHWDTAFPSQTGKKADIITYYIRVDMDMEKQKHTLLVKYSNTAPVSNLTMLIKIKNLP